MLMSIVLNLLLSKFDTKIPHQKLPPINENLTHNYLSNKIFYLSKFSARHTQVIIADSLTTSAQHRKN